MLKIFVGICCALAVGCAPVVYASPSIKAAQKLAAELDRVHSIHFYFISRTGKYSIKGDRFKAKSSLRIYRECGNNCRQFMEGVIKHLRDALPTNCPQGQQNVLVQIGGIDHVMYSYSGRTIKFNNRCYFNKSSVNEIIQREKFIFQ